MPDLAVFRRSGGGFSVIAERRRDRPTFRVRAWFEGHRRHQEEQPTEARAVAAAEAIWNAFCDGQLSDNLIIPPDTLDELVERFVARGDLSPSTRRSYERCLRLFVTFTGPDRHPASVSRSDVHRWITSLTCKPVSRASYLRQLRACLHWAIRQGFLQKDPCENFRIKVEHTMRSWLEYRDWERFLEACSKAHQIRAAFALETGLRAGEIASARWSWLQGSIGRPSIRIGHDPITGFTPKWGNARAVPLSKKAQEMLEAARRTWGETGFIFASERLASPNFARENRLACDRAGLPRVDFHGLRRSAGARWLELGFELIEVSRLLGHRSITTTDKWYAGISTGRLASRFDLVDRLTQRDDQDNVVVLRRERP